MTLNPFHKPQPLTSSLTSKRNSDSTEYVFMAIYAAVMMLIVCIGIPLSLFTSLYKWRAVLNPSGFQELESKAIEIRMRSWILL